MLQPISKYCCFMFLLCFYSMKSQTNEQSSTLLWYDQTLGKENAGVFNGPVYINRYRLNTETHPYLISDDFVTGSVIYDKQYWPGMSLLYDIHNDVLIEQSEGNYSGMAISLITQKTTAFTIYDKSFVNLRGINDWLPGLVGEGFYQEVAVGPKSKLYIKHHKHRREIIRNNQVYDSFSDQNQLIYAANENYYPVNSKREIISAFPTQKRAVNEYYQMNRNRAKSNPLEFTAELLQYLSNLDPKQTSR